MAKVKRNASAPQFSGSIGKLNYYTLNGEQIVREKPERDPDKPFTAPQLAVQDGFKDAVSYARDVVQDPERKAIYQAVAAVERRDVYHRALSDALSAPVVLEINALNYNGAAGQSLVIKARDDFKVASVSVLIRDPAGVVLEEGTASGPASGSVAWTYETAVNLPQELSGVAIAVTAMDCPGNKATAQVDHLLRRNA